MEPEKNERDLLAELFKKLRKPAEVLSRAEAGNAACEMLDNGSFVYYRNGEKIIGAHSSARVKDGRRIDTRTAARTGTEVREQADCFGSGKTVVNTFEDEGLILTQYISMYEGEDFLNVQISLKDRFKLTETNYLSAYETIYPDWSYKPLFLSLDQKMLLTPFDNDMWVRYESTPPRPGRTSYDVTAIYDERTNEGLVIGSVDFDTWKNAIQWSFCDARCVVAFSGAADAATHDTLPHGYITGEEVFSARFIVKWSPDVRDGMKEYGRLCTKVMPARPWHGKVPFGWNSYSALAGMFQLSHWKAAGDFIHDELTEFCDEDGVTFINIDAARIEEMDELRAYVDTLHARGQKAGWYCGPCISHRAFGQFAKVAGTDIPLSEIFLKDFDGRIMPAMDSSVPLDVTHPLWEVHARNTIKRLVDLNVDYIKIDFLSHACVEGNFYNKDIKTGRQAINLAYRIMSDEMSVEKCGREIFVDLSIAPIFPYFLGHARRSCCDTFGHYDDTRYALNALNFGFWECGTIYRFGDPDHCALYHSKVDGRTVTTEIEAKSRFNLSVIAGTVLLLSDNFGPVGDESIIQGARERVKRLVNNKDLIEVARFGEAFVPLYLKSDTTNIYTLKHDGRFFAALFNFEPDRQTVGFPASLAGFPEKGRIKCLNCGKEFEYSDGLISADLEGYDSVIYEIS